MTLKQSNPLHVVAVPYPAQGHINPMLHLCQQLVPHGLTFTFVNTHHIHQRMQRSSANPSTDNKLTEDHMPHQHANGSSPEAANGVFPHGDEGPVMQTHSHEGSNGCNPIRMVFVEGGSPPEQHAHLKTSQDAIAAAQEMKWHVEQLISNIMEEQPVAFILTDVLCGWGSATARKFGLPWVCFWAASAATASIFMYLADIAGQGKLIPVTSERDGEMRPVLDDIPGLPPTSFDEMPKTWDETGKQIHKAVKCFAPLEQASFLLLNTFSELEAQVLLALSKRCPILTVGPLIPSPFMIKEDVHTCPDKTGCLAQATRLGGRGVSRPSLHKEDRTCLDWLDTQAPSSVLFVSFGSISVRTEEQLEELAHGVQASGCPFLWVSRPDISVDTTPLAVQQHGRGLIVPWAPQLEILSHPAVGGFVTHCGWNSVIESVAMGVPMLCWADTGERMSNQRFVVQFWKCGLDMVFDDRRFKQHIDEAVLVRREELEKSIRCLMTGESGALVRARATELRGRAISAFQELPSQFNHLVHAIQHKDLITTKLHGTLS